MERDRAAVLVQQAAFAGVVDFAKARPLDPAWRRWLARRLDRLEEQNLARVYALQHAQNLAAVAVTTGDALQDHWKRAGDLLVKTFDGLFPWLRREDGDRAEAGRAAAADLSAQWAAAYGDPADPAVQERIWATARALEAGTRGA